MPAHRSSRRTNPKYTFSDDDNEEFSPSRKHSKCKPIPKPPFPALPSPRSSHTRKRPSTHIRRPRNAFIIFRSDFCEQQKMKESGIESDHRHISRIAAHVWNNLPEDKKEAYRAQAEAEKLAHKAAYPEYRYTPVGRPKEIKRKAKRDDSEEQLRCRQLAELVISGVEGSDLQHAVKALDEGAVKVELTHRTSQAARKKVTSDLSRAPRIPAFERVASVDVDVKEESPSPRYLGLPGLSPLSDTDEDSRASSDDISTPTPSYLSDHTSRTTVKSTPDAEISQPTPYDMLICKPISFPNPRDVAEPEPTPPNPHMRPTATSDVMLASLCFPESAPPSPAGTIYMPLPTCMYHPFEDVSPSPWPEVCLPLPIVRPSATPPPTWSPVLTGPVECRDDHDTDTPMRRSPSPVTISPWKPSVDSEALLVELTEELSLSYPEENEFAEYFAA